MTNDLLPPSASVQEKAASLAFARPVQVPIKTLWDPQTCPAGLLPWLAWALSVDGWDANWTETQKRGAIGASVAVHKTKGTIGALRRALQAIGYEVDIDEATGVVYTFRIILDVGERSFPEAEIARIQATAQSAKNARSKLASLVLRGSESGPGYAAAYYQIGDTDTVADPSLLDAANDNLIDGFTWEDGGGIIYG